MRAAVEGPAETPAPPQPIDPFNRDHLGSPSISTVTTKSSAHITSFTQRSSRYWLERFGEFCVSSLHCRSLGSGSHETANLRSG